VKDGEKTKTNSVTVNEARTGIWGMITCSKRDPYLDEPGGRHGAGGKGRRKRRKAGEQSGTDL
jgi:hypothetical protein